MVSRATAALSALASFAVLVGVVLVVGAPALAFPEFSRPYTQPTDGDCVGDGIDPINVYFFGERAGIDGVLNNMHQHTAWDSSGGSPQRLMRKIDDNPLDYRCHTMDDQRANESIVESRYHTRLWFIPASSGATKKTVGDAHHEDWVIWAPWNPCGPPGKHAVDSNGDNGSGFDQGRHRLKEVFDNHNHYVESHYWGNTQNFKQCDGDWAARTATERRLTLATCTSDGDICP
jgi:hypothetical protein